MRIAIQLFSLFVENSKPFWRSSAYNFRYTAKYSNKMANKTALLLISDGSEEMEAVITADVLRRAEVCKIIICYNLKYTIYYILYTVLE